MKKVITIMGLFGLIFVQAQVGINQDAPKATLDIEADSQSTVPQGVLIPRLKGQQLLSMQVGVDQNALLVYITEPVAVAQRTGAFSKVDSRGFYNYFADPSNPSNSYWKKIIEVVEQRPTYTFLQQEGIDNDIAINNYYKTSNAVNNYDPAFIAIQNYLGTPTNQLALPHSNLPSGQISIGGINFRAKLGAAYDDMSYAPALNTTVLGSMSSHYYGIDAATNIVKSGVALESRQGGIYINPNGSNRIDINSYQGNNPIALNGNVGIGTIAPAQKLHVSGVMRLEPQATPPTGALGDLYVGTNNKLYFHNGTAWKEVQLAP